MSKKKKQRTTNQQEWLQMRANLRRNITNMQKLGLYIPQSEDLYNMELPQRVTKKKLQQMKELSSIAELGKQAFRMDYNTGEQLNTYAEERKENAKRKRKKLSEAQQIIQNAKDEIDALPESYIEVSRDLSGQIDEMLKSIGTVKTAEHLQSIANSDKFLEVFMKYLGKDYYTGDDDTELIGTKNLVATMRAMGISEEDIQYSLDRMDLTYRHQRKK